MNSEEYFKVLCSDLTELEQEEEYLLIQEYSTINESYKE